jgi:UDP-N-acetylglucosamine acyltransferase
MNIIHHTAIVSNNAKLGDNVNIGAYCVVGDDVEIGDETILKSHIVIDGITKIGKNNIIFPFTTIGQAPQDLKFRGEKSRVEIGDNNTIRENVTIHLGTQGGAMVTKVGSECLLMVGVHIAHDCVVGNNSILANNATLAGHVEIGENVVIGGLSAIHQFVRIGKYAMIGGMSGVENDVIPYGTVSGERASLVGLNLVGMRRANLARNEIHALRNFFKKIFTTSDIDFIGRSKLAAVDFSENTVQEVISFITSKSERSFCHIKNK